MHMIAVLRRRCKWLPTPHQSGEMYPRIFRIINGQRHYYADWGRVAHHRLGTIAFVLDQPCNAAEFQSTLLLGVLITPVPNFLCPDVAHLNRRGERDRVANEIAATRLG